MKEKIWKLIELLNEYEKKSAVHWYEWYWQDVLMCRYFIVKDGFEFYTDEATTIAISKYYWFIKWLVENDKIDYEKVRSWEWNWSRWHFETVQPEYYIIMLLAIQDEPIRFLCEILK